MMDSEANTLSKIVQKKVIHWGIVIVMMKSF